MLAKQRIITARDANAIEKGLRRIQAEIENGSFVFQEALEDIHMNIEARLKELIGDAAGRLHTARSRNDQVATDARLYARETITHLDAAVQALQKALLTQASDHVETVMPGLTHLQPAQPISFAHHLLAYVEMLGRDRGRLRDAALRLNECPLGAAALAGTAYPIDRQMTAKALGFRKPMANSLDAVSDRDYMVETVSALAILATHLSRLAEELVFWSSPLVGFVTLDEAFTSGSSIMPQKRNPDAAELIRGKTGTITGALVSLLTMLKALPLAYNKDMQEDKRPFFAALDESALCVAAMQGMVATMKPNSKTMLRACSKGYLNATDLADWMVTNLRVPFRTAHELTGKLVRMAEARQCGLEELPLAEMQRVHAGITRAAITHLAIDRCVARRISEGGTAPSRVRSALAAAKKAYL